MSTLNKVTPRANTNFHDIYDFNDIYDFYDFPVSSVTAVFTDEIKKSRAVARLLTRIIVDGSVSGEIIDDHAGYLDCNF